MNKRKCFDCGKPLEWVGRGPGWMNSDQWDASKAGDYFAQCSKASHPNGNCYFNEQTGDLTTLKRITHRPESTRVNELQQQTPDDRPSPALPSGAGDTK